MFPLNRNTGKQIPGLIHDQSGSGQTLFVEPAAVVELGNEYKKLVIEEQAEIERILTELTALVKPSANDIYTDLQTLGIIDPLLCKGEACQRNEGGLPENKR